MQTNSAATPLLSVVVPVFKTERWLRRCLDSLLGQSLEEIEIVCVDDASPDGCAAVLAEYASRDARVRVVTHARNEGLFRARLSGIRAARGAFIAFLDSDDYVNLDCYRAALDAADGADMAGRRRRRGHDRAPHRARGRAGLPLYPPALCLLPL